MIENWKIKRSRISGKIPHISQFTDSSTVVWNEADGKLYGLRIDEGTSSVVIIGGGINNIGEAHSRLHSISNPNDHAPNPSGAGRIVMLDEPQGNVILMNIVAFDPPGDENEQRIIITKDYVTGELTLDVNETAIDHNNLKNFEALRHKRIKYEPEHKSYFVES